MSSGLWFTNFSRAVCWAAFLAGGALHAALEWQQTTLEIPARTGQKSVVAAFHYTNAGDRPVTITGTRHSCPCSSAIHQPRVIEPGASGTLDVSVFVGNRKSPETVAIEVLTDDGKVSPLTLRVLIREVVSTDRTALLWEAGAAPVAKSVLLRAVADKRIAKVSVQVSGGPFDHALVPVEEGRIYRLDITPREPLAREVRGVALFAVECEGEPAIELPVRLRAK